MTETAIVEVKCGVYTNTNNDWQSIDGGISTVAIYHNDENETFRVIAKATTNEYVMNAWILRDTQFTKLSDNFFCLKVGGRLYGLSFSDTMDGIDFSVNVDNAIQILSLKQSLVTDGRSASPINVAPPTFARATTAPPSSSSTTSEKPLAIPVNIAIPPPVLEAPPVLETPPIEMMRRYSSADATKLPSYFSTMTPGLQSSGSSNGGASNNNNSGKDDRKTLLRKQSLSAKELREKYKSMRVKPKTTANERISAGKNISLNNIAKSFEEEALNLVRSVNQCVTHPSTVNPNILTLQKINEMMTMTLILTQQSGFSVAVHNLMKQMEEFITLIPDKGTIDQNAVKAATGLAYKLVRESLIKLIHHELSGLQNLGIQMACIITYIANIDIDHVAMIQLLGTMKAFYVAAFRLFDGVATLMHIETNSQTEQKVERSVMALNSSQESGGNIYFEKVDLSQLDGNKDETRVGSLNQLVLKLTSDTSYDNKFLKSFITTYRSFTNPWTLLAKLKERFYVPTDGSYTPATIATIQLRVCIVLKYWVENQIDDFDEDMILELRDFILTLTQYEALRKMAESLHHFLLDRISQREQATILWFQEPQRESIPEEGICLSDLFNSSLPAQIIAEQLTLIDFEIFKKIEAPELLNQSWSSPKLKHRAPNVVACIHRSTRVSFWIATMILSQDDKQFRIKMVEKMIDIGKCLYELNNYNTLMGVLAALNLSSIFRLKGVEKNAKYDTFRKLEKLMNPGENYNHYRAQLTKCAPPCIPYIGVHLTDLTFIEDGNPDWLNGFINFKKRDMLMDTIMTLQQFQQTPYTCEIVEPVNTFLQELPFLDDKQLYNISTFLEPKGSKKAATKKSS